MVITDVVLSAGHSTNPKRDMGAVSGKYIEGILTAEARAILYKHLVDVGKAKKIANIEGLIKTDGDDTILADSLKAFQGKTKDTTLCLDIHFNSADNSKVYGIECLVPVNYTALELKVADTISDIGKQVLNTNERGVIGSADGVKTEADSARKTLGWMRLTGINVLIEVEFISNPDAMKVYTEKKNEFWLEVAKYIISLLS